MTEKFLSLALTVLVSFLISLAFRRWKGIDMKYGLAGLVLIIMPHCLAIFQHPEDHIYNVPLLIGAIIGMFLLMKDVPRN